MAASLTLSVLEIILLFFGAVILGITIHFFLTSRKSLKATMTEKKQTDMAKNEWKQKFMNDMEMLERELAQTKQQLQEAQENENIYSIEAEEMRLQNKRLSKEIEALQQRPVATVVTQAPAQPLAERSDYLDQLLLAQNSLMEHNQKINELLGNIDVIKEKEEKQRQILRDNAELSEQLTSMRVQLSEKEKEIAAARQKEQLTSEMSSALDSAYSEFHTLQSKIQKMEAQLTASKMANLQYEDLKEEHNKLVRDFEEQKAKATTLGNDNQHLHEELALAEEKWKEANFQRQQLQKRVAYLEELNSDLQVVSDANKKLESQLRRIGELESMLNVVSEERDQLMGRK